MRIEIFRKESAQLILLSLAGTAAMLLSVKIPHTEVFIDGRWVFGFVGFAILRHCWSALILMGVLCNPMFSSDVSFLFGFFGNLTYALPCLLVLRPLHQYLEKHTSSLFVYSTIWMLMVLLCYQLFITPVIWGSMAVLKELPVIPEIVTGINEQPYMVESLLVGILSAAIIVMLLAVKKTVTFQLIFENSRDGVVTVSPTGRILEANPAFCQMLGYSLSELRRMKNFYEVTPEKWRAWEEEEIWNRRLMNEGASGLYEKEYIRKDGSIFPVELQSYTVWDDDGNVKYLWGVARDITDRKKAENELRTSEEKFRGYIEHAPQAVFIADATGHYLEANPAAAQMTGYSEEEITSMTFQDLILEDEIDHVAAHLQELLDSGETELEGLFVTKSGEKRWWKVSATRLSANCLFSIVEDITERKRIECQLRDTNERMELAADSAGFGVWDLNLNTNTLVWDKWMYKLYGLSPGEFENVYEGWKSRLHPDDVERAEREVKQAISETKHFDTEFRIVLPNKTIRYIKAKAVVVDDADGAPDRMTGINYDITEQREAENALRESERKFRSYIENANDILYVLSAEGAFTYISPNWREYVGEPASAAIGKSFKPYVHPDDVHVCEEFLAKVIQTKSKQQRVRYRVRHADGSWRWHSSNGAPLFDDEGNVAGYLGIARDITDLMHSNELLETSEKRYRSMAKNIPGAIFVVGRDWRYVSVDGKALEEAGLKREDLIGLHVKDAFPELWEELEQNITRAFQGESVYYEVSYRGRLYSNQAALIVDKSGKTEQVVIITLDITERREAALQLHELNDQLQLALEGGDLGTWDWNISTNKVVFNDQWALMKGYLPEEIEPNLSSWKDLVHPDDLPHVQKALQAHLDGLTSAYESEFRMKSKSGEWIWILDRGKVIERDENGQPLRACGTHMDITKRKQAETERQKLQEQLIQAQKMESVGRLAGGVAHDFNNMLNVILGYTDLALNTLDSKDPLYSDLEKIRDAGRRSASLTRQLLAFARKQHANPRAIDLNKEIESMLSMLKRMIGETVELEWAPGGDIHTIVIDPSQLDQILANLVVNARDAMDGVGAISIATSRIEVSSRDYSNNPDAKPGTYTCIAVQDDGCGMSPETIEQLFEPFFTTKEVGKGTGLGLATVYGIVKQNDGFIHVESKQGEGSRFCICFPEREEGPVDKKKKKSDCSVPTNTHVLLVEDEKSILTLTERMLQDMGCIVQTASSPSEALRIAGKPGVTIELLISDMAMPEMSGPQLAKLVEKQHPDMKVLFMSGYAADELKMRGAQKNMIILQKPFSYDELSKFIHDVLA